MPDKKPVILIVDDTTINIHILNEALNNEYQTYFAMNGVEALQKAREITPDLILLDIMMPVMNGFEACRILKEDENLRDIPVIFITALGKVSDESHGLQLGAADYITKPINPGLVRLRVYNQIELKRRTDELKAAVARTKRLEGIISICMYCKKIRCESEAWQQMEQYITEHSEALFSHGICPECYENEWSSIKRK